MTKKAATVKKLVKKPTKIKQIIKKPSQALFAMCDGLEKQDRRRRKFKIDMSTYGDVFRGLCYGCAATCAVQEISQHNFIPGEMNQSAQAAAIGIDFDDLEIFETAINYARMGRLNLLFCYFKMKQKHSVERDNNRYWLNSSDWREQIEGVRKHARQLRRHGL